MEVEWTIPTPTTSINFLFSTSPDGASAIGTQSGAGTVIEIIRYDKRTISGIGIIAASTASKIAQRLSFSSL